MRGKTQTLLILSQKDTKEAEFKCEKGWEIC